MSISSTAEPSQQFGSGLLTTLAAATKRLFVAYITWRMEQSAIAVLLSMSDRELRDIGLSRSDIPGAVRSEAARDRAFPEVVEKEARPPRRADTAVSLNITAPSGALAF